jgi:two-component system NarL family sensor kinase
MHTLANIYGMQGKIKEAFAIDEEGIVMAEKTNSESSKSQFYDNMGNCYLYNEPPDYPKALEYFIKTLHIDSAFGNKKQMSDSYSNLGDVFLTQGKFSEAIPYLQRSLSLAEESGFAEGKLRALKMLSRAYRNSNRPDDAYTILQAAMAVKDSLVNSSSEARIAELQTVYETEKKQQQINLQQEQLSKKNFILGGIILLSLLSALLGISAWLRYRLKQRARLQNEIMKQQELASKSVIKAEENERQRIARDLHDGIGQMMSAAKMNLSAFEADMQFASKEQQSSLGKAIGLVDESCKEIRSVSHNMMPNALLKNNLGIAIQDFIDKLEKKTLETHLYTEGLEERLDSDLETVLYRIIQECVNNVIKHANATSLDITVIKDKEEISATIEDNGKGFDTAVHSTFEGIGLKNIQTRVKYLKGTVDIESTPGRGTLIAINVPVDK